MSTEQQPQQPSFGGASADLAAQLTAPVSPTTEKSTAEAQRRTSEWKPPAPGAIQRTFSFDEQEHKHAMMAASGTLSGTGSAAGFSERT
ncbi:unnamed protein product [Discula destructiva]